MRCSTFKKLKAMDNYSLRSIAKNIFNIKYLNYGMCDFSFANPIKNIPLSNSFLLKHLKYLNN